jgi:hypothetical protein
MSVVTKEMLDAAVIVGRNQERERIIKLLEEQYDNCDENGKCIYLKHMPECCNCDLIALIKGENK